MAVEDQREPVELDEDSWVYLSAGASAHPEEETLLEKVIEACANSGWKTVSHPPRDRRGVTVDPGLYFASVSHAVEHADVVVAVLGGKDEAASRARDAEAYHPNSHGRPVGGVEVSEGALDTEARMLLSDYERARIVTCSTPGECATSLQEALSDPSFAETIRQAG